VRLASTLLATILLFPACHASEPPASAPLTKIAVTDPRYEGFVFLVATIRRSGSDFVITNDSTQPWFDVALVLTGGADEYWLQLAEVNPGQTVTAAAAQFATRDGVAFDARRVMPRTLIVSAEIGEGGPTGAYAVRL
jgi:hypothetical protein